MKLGRNIKLNENQEMTTINPGSRREYAVTHLSATIAIGKDHTAELIMTREAHKALQLIGKNPEPADGPSDPE